MTTCTAKVDNITSTPPSMTEQCLQQFIDAWLWCELEALAGFITDDCVYITTTVLGPGRRFHGPEAVLEGFAEMLPESGDGTCFGEVFVDGSHRYVEWWVVGEGSTAPCMRGCDVFTFRDGLIARKDAFREVEAR